MKTILVLTGSRCISPDAIEIACIASGLQQIDRVVVMEHDPLTPAAREWAVARAVPVVVAETLYEWGGVVIRHKNAGDAVVGLVMPYAPSNSSKPTQTLVKLGFKHRRNLHCFTMVDYREHCRVVAGIAGDAPRRHRKRPQTNLLKEFRSAGLRAWA